MVALFNAWNKISMSVNFYYMYRNPQTNKSNKYDYFNLQLFCFLGFSAIVSIWLITKIDIKAKVKKSFKHVILPPQNSKAQSTWDKKQKNI